MDLKNPYSVVPWHGEGESIFYVIDERDEGEVIESFSTREHGNKAKELAERLVQKVMSKTKMTELANTFAESAKVYVETGALHFNSKSIGVFGVTGLQSCEPRPEDKCVFNAYDVPVWMVEKFLKIVHGEE